MRTEGWYPSCGAGNIHYSKWTPDAEPKAVLQIVHGISDHIGRYAHFAAYMADQGYVVVGEDHMGHGGSVNGDGIEGYFHGGWFCAVEDTYRLLQDTKAAYPNLPYVLLGHSMGSFLARTILYQYPQSGIDAVVLSGTCWQPAFAMPAIVKIMEAACRMVGEKKVSKKLQDLVFGSYNLKVEHRRTPMDWVCRDHGIVDAHPMTRGFQPTAGLLRDMMIGISGIEMRQNLSLMRKELPVFFVAGGDDPVGNFGQGVRACADAFRKAGMSDVSVRIYPLCRHEILNEINKEEIFEDILGWIGKKMKTHE